MKKIAGKVNICKIMLTAAAVAAAAVTLSCVYPTHSDPDFLEEQQSVWQYLSVFSIFQDRVPERGANLSPEDMFAAINDTLGGARYTGYYYPPGSDGRPKPELPEPVVESLTGTTVYFGFYEFDDREIDRFRAFTDYMADFDNIVIDLRFNGGGYIYIADEMANEFLPYGTDYIEYRYRYYNSKTRRGEDSVEVEKTVNRNPKLVGKNVVILTNEWSASASEILASALKDGMNAHITGGFTNAMLEEAITGGREFVTGQRTYGKGRGQRRITRSGRDMLSITFMEIRGVSERTGDYHIYGIEPDPIPMEYVLEALEMMDISVELFLEALRADPNSTNMTIRAVREMIELYAAVKTVDPNVIIVSDADNGASAMSKRRFMNTLKTVMPETPVSPRVTGAFVVDNDELFR